MLSIQEINVFRQRVMESQSASVAAPRLWGICIGGPLHGICVRIDPASFHDPKAMMEWETVTERGRIVAQYSAPDEHGWMHFICYLRSDGVESVVRAESHTPDYSSQSRIT